MKMTKKLIACGICKHLVESPTKMVPHADRLTKQFRDEEDACGRWRVRRMFDSFLGEKCDHWDHATIFEANPTGRCKHFKLRKIQLNDD